MLLDLKLHTFFVHKIISFIIYISLIFKIMNIKLNKITVNEEGRIQLQNLLCIT